MTTYNPVRIPKLLTPAAWQTQRRRWEKQIACTAGMQ